MRDDGGIVPIALVALAILVLTGMDATMKIITQTLPVVQGTLLRYGVAAIVLLPLFLARRERIVRPSLPAHIARGTLIASTASLFFFAISRLPLALVIAIAFLAPLFIAILGRIILGEPVARRTGIAIGTGFSGVLVILAGEIEVGAPAIDLLAFAAAIAAAFGYALAQVLIRRQTATETAVAIVTFQSVVAAAVLVVPGAFVWEPIPADLLPLAVAVGVMGGTGHLLLAAGLARGKAARLALIEYTAFPWAAILGFLLFGEVPRVETLIGAAIIVGSCLYGLRRDAAVPRGRATARVPIPDRREPS